MDDVEQELTPATEPGTPAETATPAPAAEAAPSETARLAAQLAQGLAASSGAQPAGQAQPASQAPRREGRLQGQGRENRPQRENRGGEHKPGEKREGRGGDRPNERGGDRKPGAENRGDRGRGGDRGPRGEGPPEIDLEKLIGDPLYLDNQAHMVVSRMRDMDSGTKSQLRRLYNAVRRAVRAPESERQHQIVMLRARLAYTIARHSLRSLDALERLLLQVTRKNDSRGYERFKDLFEAIVAYNE